MAQSTQRLNAARQSSAAKQDLGSLINAANEELTNLGGGTILIEGGGSIKSQVTLKHHTSFDSSTYACDITGITDAGCFLVGDNVLVKGTWQMPKTLLDYFKNGNGRNSNDLFLRAVQALTPSQLAATGTTILEPTFANGTVPAVEVFQALGDSCCSHTERAHDIAVVGFHIKGRQKVYDGGVRSTILLGNCTHCTAQNNYLEDTASIGITFGGSALGKNYFANDGLAWHNVTSGVAAANIAGINSENLYVMENYAFRLGHHEPKFGGGVCGFDLETNSTADHSKNIFVFNNLYDFEGSLESAGNAICLQDPYIGANHGLVVAANNIIIGGREDLIHRFMSNGLFLNGLRSCRVTNNYVFRTGQNAIQGYGLRDCLIQDNDFESTGGGGNASVMTVGAVNTTFRRNNYRDRPGLGVNTQAGFVEKCGQNNVYENNLVNGKNVPAVARVACQ
ncbi:MAG TPA: hypothetical protein VGQ39_07685 [Pyrinomonadaceae bacterium]|nr:hypothetical protein [Pyrinomonadaceae bacterium]